MAGELLPHGTEQQALEATVATRADHEEIRRLRRIEQDGTGSTLDDVVLDLHAGRNVRLGDDSVLRRATIGLGYGAGRPPGLNAVTGIDQAVTTRSVWPWATASVAAHSSAGTERSEPSTPTAITPI